MGGEEIGGSETRLKKVARDHFHLPLKPLTELRHALLWKLWYRFTFSKLQQPYRFSIAVYGSQVLWFIVSERFQACNNTKAKQ